MSIKEYRNYRRSRMTRLERFAGAALVSAAVFAAAPRAARAELDYLTTGNQSWFNLSNWVDAVTLETGTLPEVFIPAGHTNAANIDANNNVMPSVGVLFDPANDTEAPGGMNANYIANFGTIAGDSTFYISNGNSVTSSAPNKLTIESGTLEPGLISIGRDGPGIIVQNGGVLIADDRFAIQSQNHPETIGSGTFEYHGGTFIGGNQVRIGAGNTTSTLSGVVGATSAGVGKLVVYNDGPDGAILISNGMTVAENSAGKGTIGIIEFHYDLNPENIGNVRPIQNDFNTTNGELSLNNTSNTSARLNLVLDAAPTTVARSGGLLTQNLGLFKNQSIGGLGTSPKLFYSMDGATAYTQGATISAVYFNSGVTYSWTISYSGLISFDNSATSAYTSGDISATGGSDVVLIGGLPVPEPGSLALLGGVGNLILARRRRK